MEIIARRKGGLFALYGLCFLVGVFAVVMAAFGSKNAERKFEFLGYFPIGVMMIVVSLVICVNYLRTPSTIIVYKDKKLMIKGKEYTPTQITNVNYKCAHSRHHFYRWGKLMLTIGGESYSYNFVAEVEEVHNRLIALMKEAVWDEGAGVKA